MNKFVKILVIFLVAIQANAQELNATVTVNSDKVPGSNKQVFQTLERSITEFLNQKKWTNKNFKSQEKIQCNFTLTILEQEGSNNFTGNIQVQSSRPVYNSSYLTPIFNFKDNDFSFRYTEFENLQYNPNSFDSNLVSVITFYTYMVLGMDGDTFARNGGTEYYNSAENVMNQAQQSSYIGWNQNDNGVTRFRLITDILSGAFSNFRVAMYNYHLLGLDIMHNDKLESKEKISNSLKLLKTIYDRRPNAILVRVFMDAKSDEIVNIFSDGPRFETDKLKDDLIRMSPTNMSKWNSIN
ncbi:DUF4835 domain-containing protein [Urechidicola croceus]|uniref:DUF4835 domain-containing protein n=2 Tax=Urechidicola croceus TaxID=1850246 RepID=A0A1D8PBQ4_9FLAO|nr:DUF4835 domain-containing protein [Urechidicola croceus]